MYLLHFSTLLFSLIHAAAIAAGENPQGVRITDVSYGGTGCNQGSLSINISDDGNVCPIYTSDLVARAGRGAAVADSRRFCQLNFKLEYPPGWSFSILRADYTGYVDLGRSTNGHVQSKYYFSGETEELVSRVDFTGPSSGYFVRQDALVWDVWSPCGNTQTMLNVVQEVAVRGNGRIATTSTEGDFINAIALKWRRC